MNIRRLAIAFLVTVMIASSVGATVVSTKVTVTTSATALLTASAREGRKHADISHACAASIFIGGSTVTTSTGRDLPSTSTMSISIIAGETVYAIVASSTCVVTVLSAGGS
jgi:hypothetical protein